MSKNSLLAEVYPHLEIMKAGKYTVNGKEVILNKVVSTIENTNSLAQLPAPPNSRGEITLEKIDTVSCILEQDTSEKIGVLSFASARAPGGGFMKGRNAQEECLCHKSNLYQTLKEQRRFYNENWATEGGLASQNLIISKDVTFFKDMDGNLVENPILTTVVTAPAVDYRNIRDDERKFARSTMVTRMDNIMKAFILSGSKTIILGAFGCGVFKNDPTEIATIFKELLINKGYIRYFDKVIFAIPGNMSLVFYNKNADKNYDAFQRIFRHSLKK